jgi:Uma2 family endonuclease
MSSSARSNPRLPPVDARLVAPESRYEVDEGRVVYVSPSDEPHGSRHSKLSALLEAHVAEDYDVASDMLTRTSELGDMAPDASVFPRARDPETGGRQIEQLAFEVVSTEALSEAARKAHKLTARGVRRVFAVDVARLRAFEWSRELGTWQILADGAAIEDPSLAAPMPVAAMVRAAKADDAMAEALLTKKNPVLMAALARRQAQAAAEATAENIIAVPTARGLTLEAAERARILATHELATLGCWLVRAATCAKVAELFADETKRD